jgi:hypothetical protein
MGLRLFFLPNYPGATLIQGVTFIPDSRVHKQRNFVFKAENFFLDLTYSWRFLMSEILELKLKLEKRDLETCRKVRKKNCLHFCLEAYKMLTQICILKI